MTLIRKAIYRDADFDSIEINESLEWDFPNISSKEPLHGLHPYPARFIPMIPRKAILEWSKEGDTVLDPFCGCGTTVLESILLGRNGIGVDNNSVAALVSRVKTANYSGQNLIQLNQFEKQFKKSILQISSNEISLPTYKNFDHWFSPIAARDLAQIKFLINKEPAPLREFLLAVMSSIIVRVSNQDSDTRYSRKEKVYSPGSALNYFQAKLRTSLKELSDIKGNINGKSQIYCSDGRDLGQIESNSIQLIVTSPPYINAYDYHKYHRHRIHWIDGNVEFSRDLEIGKHDTYTRPNANPDSYFNDLELCLSEWFRVLNKGGKALIVIGDGIVQGKAVPSGDLMSKKASDLGFELRERWIRNLQVQKKSFNANSRMDREHVILLEK